MANVEFLIALIFFVSLSSARVTILVESSEAAIRNRRQTSTNSGNVPEACQNAEAVNKTTITFPRGFESVLIPWMRSDLNPLLFTSAALRRSWERQTSMKVQGMNATVGDVIAHLLANNCLFLPWGGSVRDMILGESPHDVDAEVSCSQDRVHSLCSEKFGIDNCEKSPWPGSTKLRIGNDRRGGGSASNTVEPMDIVQWKDTFEVPPTMWEFTPNSLTYYAMPNNGPQALIDLTGMGFADVCEKKIRIAAPEDDWPAWAGKEGEELIKRLRYWKLRIKGFEARDPQTSFFILDSLLQEFNQSEVQKFYCIYVIFGVYHDEPASCTILTNANTTEMEESKRAFNAAFEKDFGTSVWQTGFKPVFDNLPIQRTNAQSISPGGNEQTPTTQYSLLQPAYTLTTTQYSFQQPANTVTARSTQSSTNPFYQLLLTVAEFLRTRIGQSYKLQNTSV